MAEIPRPVPAPGEVLIEVEACGVCHSDLHVADGDWPELRRAVKFPLVPGHEIVGRVVEMGSGVTELAAGDRVGVPWIHWTCGACEPCRAGRENLCVAQKITGVMVDGGYARFVVAPATHAQKIPAALAAAEAAPLLCAGVTVYRALGQAAVKAGERVAIFGAGGLGHLAVQIARAQGAEVIAVDLAEEKLALARECGAQETLNAATGNVVEQLRARGGVHVALVASAAKAAYDAAFFSLRPAGTLVVVGLPAEPLTFSAVMMAATEVRIVASAVGTRADLRAVLALAAEGKLRCRVTPRPLAEANAALEELRRGQILARAVLIPR